MFHLYLRDISIRVQTKHLRGVHQGKRVDMVHVLRYRGALGYRVTLVEIEALLEHRLAKPHLE